jgi:23S rRNA (uracil1939-C5)-methyltransferase
MKYLRLPYGSLTVLKKMNDIAYIDNLAFGGFGIGSFGGMKLFVPYTIPGEQVGFRIVQSRKRYAWAELKEVMRPSTQRRQPPCHYFGRCGGCHWQHMVDSAQTFWKERVFRDVLFRLSNIEGDRIKPLIPSLLFLGYRHRITLKVRRGNMGFISERSRTHVEIERCLLAYPAIQEMMVNLKGKLSAFPPCDLEVVVSPYEPGLMMSARFEANLGCKKKEQLKDLVSGLEQIKSLYISAPRDEWEISFTSRPPGKAGLSFEVDLPFKPTSTPLNLTFFPAVFIQVNWKQNLRLMEEILSTVNSLGEKLRILEVYAGAGNFTVPLAAAGHTLVTVEQSARAVSNARFNLSSNNLNGVIVRQQRAESALLEIEAQKQKFDVLMVDPPRTGLKREISTLARLKIPYLIYISCDPATLSRDLKIFMSAGYEVKYVHPLDFFPQTYHVESVSFLCLN